MDDGGEAPRAGGGGLCPPLPLAQQEIVLGALSTHLRNTVYQVSLPGWPRQPSEKWPELPSAQSLTKVGIKVLYLQLCLKDLPEGEAGWK